MLPSNLLASMPWAKLVPTKTVIIPYARLPIKPIGRITLNARKGNTTSDLTFQVIDTDQPALLSTEDSKALGVLTLNADFIRKCSTTKPPLTPLPGVHKDSAAGLPPIPQIPQSACGQTLDPWSSFQRTVLHFFMALASLALHLNTEVKPIHVLIHRQPISKLESIKAALDRYEATGQLVRVSQPTDWTSNMVVWERESTPTKPGKICICLDPSQTLTKAI